MFSVQKATWILSYVATMAAGILQDNPDVIVKDVGSQYYLS